MKARLSNILKILLFCLFIFSSSNFYAQTKMMKMQNIPRWLEKTNIFAGDIPQDILLQTNTTVIAWGNIAPLQEDQGWLEIKISYVHSLGIKYVSGLSPITTVGKVYNQRPELADASCINIHGEKIQMRWYPKGLNEPFYWACTNNPTWQNYLKEVIERSIDSGADGIHIDEIYGTEHVIMGERGCFCDFCMDGFRNFLKNKYSDDELKNEYGIADIDSFHYGGYIINNGYLAVWEGEEPWRVPLFDQYRSYQKIAVQKVMRNLILETKQYALNNFGKEISYSANINDLNPSGLKFTDDLDVFILEYFYMDNGYPPIGKATPRLKFTHSLDDKTGILMTAVTTNADLLKRSKTSNLMKIYIAEAYAAQGSFLVPYEIRAVDETTGTSPGSYTADIPAISPYYQFIINHPVFYEDISPISDVGLIYNYDHEWQKQSFYGAAYALSDLQLQYDVIFTGDEHFLYNPLVKENLNEYEVVILPGSWDILDQDFNTISDYLNDGGKVIGIGNLALIDTLDNRVENPILESFKTQGYHSYGQGIFYYSQEDFGPNYLADRSFNQISLFSEALDSILTQRTFYAAFSTTRNIFAYKNPSTADIFMHIVNYNYDINTDNYIPEDSIQISLIIPDTSEYTNAFVASPDFSSLKSIPIFSSGDSVHFTIPVLHIYDVAYISKRSAPGTISIISPSPSYDTTVVSGELLELSINVQNNSGFPLFYNWMVNGFIDSIAHSNSYQIKKDRAYEGRDTIKVIIANGFQQLEHEWLVNFKKYIFPNLLFDESHNEYNTISFERAKQINPDHPEWVYFGILKSKIEQDYNIERYESGVISSQVLNNYDALIISAPRDEFLTQEINDIIAFVTSGGRLFFLGDCGLNTSINNLLKAFGIHYINGVIFEPAPPGQDGGNPQVLDFIDHEALGNNPQFDMNWGGSFSVSSPAMALGFTDSTTWRDLNWDKIKDINELSGPFTIVCVSEFGNGRIFCIADNSLHDDYIEWEKSLNDDLFLNALKWLTESVNQIPSSVESNIDIHKDYKLYQNYPNPFNPTTKIEFMLPKSSKVEIKIYNMLGQEIKTLVDGNFAPGNHVVVWDGTDRFGKMVSSGLYLYRMKAGDFVEVKKSLLLK